MKTYSKNILLAVMVTVGVAACAPSLFPTEMPVSASLNNSGDRTTLVPGQPLEIRLPSNPSTGYRWSYTLIGDPVLRLDTVDGAVPGANGMVGAPGEELWSFRAQGAGHAVLTYEYTRSWEKNTPPAKTFTLIVDVAAH